MTQKQHGRRRADTRVKTPLTELTAALNANSGVVGRRAAVVAAAGGLVVAAGLPSAVASTDKDNADKATSSQQTESFEAQKSISVEPVAKSAKDSSTAGVVNLSVKATKAPKKAVAAEGTAAGATGKSAGKSAGKSVSIPDGSKAQKVIGIAKQYVGVPYVSGGTSPSGWDCSGYTQFVFAKVGVSLPRTSGEQHGAGHIVSRSEAKPGDIIWSPGHVGIYAGGGMMYDAGNPRVDTSYRSINWMVSAGAQFVRVL